ncbi:hypothetical protein MLD38_038836 [Melastoma candidum]|uniref:Uncharacterized protein n=1 Tax=Melastoma candidum TaxID=119954 RepID=A0ACB9L0X4_9MYRT|nr:hypothetical protein MLD38_038836 [Melastoma candidum]
MAVTSYTEEFASTVSPARLFKALVTESHVFIPKAVPGGIKSVEFLEGDGGAGSIKASGLFKAVEEYLVAHPEECS